MWILDPSWRNLAVGCERAKRLEAAQRERWYNPIQQAEQRAQSRARDAEAARLAACDWQWAARLAACEQRNVLARERFAERRAGWQQRDTKGRERFAQETSAWQAREAARRSASINCGRSGRRRIPCTAGGCGPERGSCPRSGSRSRWRVCCSRHYHLPTS